ncbi:MAG: RNA 2',3'-cyclic phosphodiesterase [Planctomycetes bacterium]|nr:RNA 2',3'-cyclic phosphodiesterase [Planctomycetota bacterium]MBI3844639.1 RNA 2',3'-cyclic phosphodiesterase [Planctomycetota bacterium]
MRTFVAIDLEDGPRQALVRVQERMRAGRWDVKWVEAENLHLTMRFLGDIDAAMVDQVIAAMRRAAAGVPPFEITLRGLGWFPPRRPPRVVWAGVVEPKGLLQRLHDALETELADLEVDESGNDDGKKGFHAHVTLGRVRTPRGVAELERAIGEQALEECRQDVRTMVMKKSDLGPRGSRYTNLGEAPLTGA